MTHEPSFDTKFQFLYEKVLNPLDAICDKKRNDAICVSNLKNAKKIDEEILAERPDVKIFLPFRFYFYRVEELFRPNTYNRFLGKKQFQSNRVRFINF